MSFLTRILECKRREVAERQRARPLDALAQLYPPPPRDFAAALRRPGIAAIAEIKRRSPSKGSLCETLDVGGLARSYVQGGAAALSVLTDREFFGGSEDDLRRARATVGLPVLRKDFTIDPYQIHEARQIGADAILLIARILSEAQLREYVGLAHQLGLAVMVEVHDENELTRAVDCQARIVGVNSRDLDTFEVSADTALRLRKEIPDECITVAESGIRTPDDVQRLEAAGYDAILVGEALMCASDPGRGLADLLGRS